MDAILVTGASGFVGGGLLSRLVRDGFIGNYATRNHNASLVLPSWQNIAVGNITENTCWSNALEGVNTVVHTAARVHVMNESGPDALSKFEEVNVAGTINLAKQAANSGVRRFVFLSSIKVNGDFTNIGSPFSSDSVVSPNDSYAISKYKAEQYLFKLAENSDMEVVVIRPPLVYGPMVKANFYNMMVWVNKGLPLPFGAIENKRSLVALDNLVDLIIKCVSHEDAANQIFLVSDDEDLSTTQLLRRTAEAMDLTSRLIPIPHRLLKSSLKIIGKSGLAERLCGSLQVDISKTKELLEWTPPLSVDEGLKKTVKEFLRMKSIK